MVALVFLNFAVWLVQKASATFLTNQIQNLNELWFGHSRFPAFYAVRPQWSQ